MLAYVIKRVLIMIPTFIGVSCMIWLVMTLAPGEPGGDAGRSSMGADATENSTENLERQNLSQRMFREQFALNRPKFWNDWTTIEKDEVRNAITIVYEGTRKHGVPAVKKAQRALEDWSHYAVPSLVELLGETEGGLQSKTLSFLKLSAYQFKTIYPKGYQPTEAEIENDRQIKAANNVLESKLLNWKKKTPQADRAVAVAAWKKWFDEQAATGRWDYRDDTLTQWKLAATDTQFGRYWSNLASGDLGLSFRDRRPVLTIIGEKLKYSLSLALPSFLLAWIIAVFLGVTSAANHNSLLDQGMGVGLFMLYSIPSFLMATVVQTLLAAEWHWFPTTRFEPIGAETLTTWEHFKAILHHLTLPIFCFTYGSLAYISRQARSGMLEVMQSDYIRTARAKGVKESAVLWKHGVRNGMMPLITLLGAALPILLGGSVVIEFIFQIPGFGLLMINSIFSKDYNVVMGVSLISAVLTLVGLLIADLMYAAVDPRVSYE